MYKEIIRIPLPIVEPTLKMRKLYSPTLNDFIYLRHETRGLFYETTSITDASDPHRLPYAANDYIFQVDSPTIFYTVKEDTLLVYTNHAADVPPYPSGYFKVKQIVLPTTEINKLKLHYRSRGLGMF